MDGISVTSWFRVGDKPNQGAPDARAQTARTTTKGGAGMLELRNVSKTFFADKEVHTLEDVNLSIREGEF